MARITVEDCLQNVPNLFQLVLVAARRARKLANGAEATLDWEHDKPTVLALREVAAGHVGLEILEEPDRPPQELLPEPEFLGEPRAPQIGLGDSSRCTDLFYGRHVFPAQPAAIWKTVHRHQPARLEARGLAPAHRGRTYPGCV